MKKLGFIALLLSPYFALANGSGNIVENGATNEASLTQSPVMSLGGSATNTIVDNDSVASTRYSLTKRDGTSVTFAGTCPTPAIFGTASVGRNEIWTNTHNSRSDAWNAAAVGGFIVPVGQAVNDCEEMIRLGRRAAQLSFSEVLIDSCITMAKAGLTLKTIVDINEDFIVCDQVWIEAAEGLHGKMRQTIALQSDAIKNLEQQNNELKAKNDVYRRQFQGLINK